MIIVKRCSITSIPVDVIVNASNPSGLGCFTPGHNCIDNVTNFLKSNKLDVYFIVFTDLDEKLYNEQKNKF